MGSIRIGVDIGGTFTDITVLDEASRKITIAKVPSRKGDPAAALVDLVERGIKLANVDASDVTMLVHGSTIVTNAILENKLPKTALVTTGGFRDLLEIGRHFRPDMYDLQQDKPVPVVPRERCFTIPERTAADGTVLLEPKTEDLDRLVDEIKQSGAVAVAICFLNSFANPSNEILVRDWLVKRLGEVSVSASCDVAPEIREFERMSTVVLNAAAMPLVGNYLVELNSARAGGTSEDEDPVDAVEWWITYRSCGKGFAGSSDHVRTCRRCSCGPAYRQGHAISELARPRHGWDQYGHLAYSERRASHDHRGCNFRTADQAPDDRDQYHRCRRRKHCVA